MFIDICAPAVAFVRLTDLTEENRIKVDPNTEMQYEQANHTAY